MTPSENATAVRNARVQLENDLQAGVDPEPSKTALTNAIISSFHGTDYKVWAANFAMAILPSGKEVAPYLLKLVEQLEEIIDDDVVSRPPANRDWIFDALLKNDEMDRI